MTSISTTTIATAPTTGGAYRVRGVTAHATGLRLPGHMAILSTERLLVSEFGGGMVRDVTDPGDYSDGTSGVRASGLAHPAGIIETSDGRVFVCDGGHGVGAVFDITKAGEVGAPFFSGLPNPYGLVTWRGSLWAGYAHVEGVGLAEVTEGGSFGNQRDQFVWGFPVVLQSEPYPVLMGCGGSWPTIVTEDRVMLGHRALGAIYDVSAGGSFENFRDDPFAWGLDQPLGMTVDPIEQRIAVTELRTGAIRLLNSVGGYSRFAQPLLVGFQSPSCIRFTQRGDIAFVCDRSVGTVYRVEFDHVGA